MNDSLKPAFPRASGPRKTDDPPLRDKPEPPIHDPPADPTHEPEQPFGDPTPLPGNDPPDPPMKLKVRADLLLSSSRPLAAPSRSATQASTRSSWSSQKKPRRFERSSGDTSNSGRSAPSSRISINEASAPSAEAALTAASAAYRSAFAAQPSVIKPDYAKWMLDDPRVNFAISTRGRQAGLDHHGIQAESDDELRDIYARRHQAGDNIIEQGQTSCCYAKSHKSWIDDPAGISWETFHTTGESTDYGDDIQ